jgi:hypothetical protein
LGFWHSEAIFRPGLFHFLPVVEMIAAKAAIFISSRDMLRAAVLLGPETDTWSNAALRHNSLHF